LLLQEVREILETNIEFLLSPEFRVCYPEVYSVIKTRINDLIALNSYAQKHISDESMIFFGSNKVLTAALGTESLNRVIKSISLFALLGFVVKVPFKKLPKPILKKVREKVPEPHTINFFWIYDYNPTLMGEMKETALKLIENPIAISKLTVNYVLQHFGLEKAKEVYPQSWRQADKDIISQKLREREFKVDDWLWCFNPKVKKSLGQVLEIEGEKFKVKPYDEYGEGYTAKWYKQSEKKWILVNDLIKDFKIYRITPKVFDYLRCKYKSLGKG